MKDAGKGPHVRALCEPATSLGRGRPTYLAHEPVQAGPPGVGIYPEMWTRQFRCRWPLHRVLAGAFNCDTILASQGYFRG